MIEIGYIIRVSLLFENILGLRFQKSENALYLGSTNYILKHNLVQLNLTDYKNFQATIKLVADINQFQQLTSKVTKLADSLCHETLNVVESVGKQLLSFVTKDANTTICRRANPFLG